MFGVRDRGRLRIGDRNVDVPLVRYADRRRIPTRRRTQEETRHADEPPAGARRSDAGACSAPARRAVPARRRAPRRAPPRARRPARRRVPPRAAPPRARPPRPTIRIGSDNFYESKLMAEIYAQVLEHAGYTVDRKFGLGSRQDARSRSHRAGQIDLVAEYVGSGLGYYDKTKITGDGAGQRRPPSRPRHDKGNLATVLGDRARARTRTRRRPHGHRDHASTSTKMSDLAAVQDQLKWGLPPDCDTNPLCKGALESYGITYPPKSAKALGRVRRRRSPRPSRARRSTSPALLDPAGHRAVRLRRARRRQEDPAGREHRPGRPQRLPGQGRQDRLLRRSSTPPRPR